MKFVTFDERKIEHSESPYAPEYSWNFDFCPLCKNTYLFNDDPCLDCTVEQEILDKENNRLDGLIEVVEGRYRLK